MTTSTRFFSMKKPWQQNTRSITQEPVETRQSADDYLISARTCIKQNNLLEALDIYQQGLSSVPTDDAQHVPLQKEMGAVSATIRRCNQQLYLIPREVWESVFRDISQHDLIHCAAAFVPWCDILTSMMSDIWSPPWCIARQRQPISVFQGSTIRVDEPGYYQPDPMDIRWLEGLFKYLSGWSSNTFETLAIEFIVIASPLICCIAKVLVSISPSFRCFVFRPQGTLSPVDVKNILDSCSRVEYIRFECMLRDYATTTDLASNELSALTHLELIFRNSDGLALIPNVIRQCPNLTHLLMCGEKYKRDDPSYKKVYGKYYKICMEHALEHCPQLKVMQIVSHSWLRRYERQKVFLLDDYGSAQKQGIHTLYYSYWWRPEDLCFITDKLDKSLESLYLDYNFYKANRTELHPLRPLYGAPNLRRVALEMGSHFGAKGKPSLLLLHDILIFLSATPALEEVVFNIGHWNSGRAGNELLQDIQHKVKDILLAIAGNCRLLRALTILGHPYIFTDNVLLEFVAKVGPNLTHLEIPMHDPSHGKELVKKALPKLTYFKAR